MSQYHYTVAYDTDLKRWYVEQDSTSFYPEGNIWDEKNSVFDNGWSFPEYDSKEEALDLTLLNTLRYIVDTFPTPEEQK